VLARSVKGRPFLCTHCGAETFDGPADEESMQDTGPQPWPPRRTGFGKKLLALGGVVLIVVIGSAAAGLLSAAAPSSSTTPTVAMSAPPPTDVPTQVPTEVPTDIPVVAPSPTAKAAWPPEPSAIKALDGGVASARYARLGGAVRDFVAKYGRPVTTARGYGNSGYAYFVSCPYDTRATSVEYRYAVGFDDDGTVNEIHGGNCSGVSAGYDWTAAALAFFPLDASAVLEVQKDQYGEPLQFYESPSSPMRYHNGGYLDLAGYPLPADLFTLEGIIKIDDPGIASWDLHYGR
jgi:hypothetical protein